MSKNRDIKRIVPKEYLAVMEEVFKEYGVKEWDYEYGRKHPQVVFVVRGITLKYALSSSPSDRRGCMGMRTSLRRICRLQHLPHLCTVNG